MVMEKAFIEGSEVNGEYETIPTEPTKEEQRHELAVEHQ